MPLIALILKRLRKGYRIKMNIIIAGCGKVGTTLGEQLVRERHEVTFIDTAPELLKR